MAKPASPCAKPECIDKDKTECSKTCPELAAYQDFLLRTEDPYSRVAINYGDDTAVELRLY